MGGGLAGESSECGRGLSRCLTQWMVNCVSSSPAFAATYMSNDGSSEVLKSSRLSALKVPGVGKSAGGVNDSEPKLKA